MKTIFYPVMLILVFSLSACRDDQQNTEKLAKANQVHLQAIALGQDLEKELRLLKEKEADSAAIQKIDSLTGLIALWQDSILEVGGFEHNHPHANEHQHKPAPKMTAQSMLDYQITAKEAIEAIGKQIEDLKSKN
ncbi:hypothetical protein [Dyadobacter psychrotolerans]|uniref:Uncharacterized protein n=1 Tax=Dyadobacter psychrotolerans TaxID=2541721 RepID=A0A4R5DB28_9BACT|nr:hypothetical protein [Dyadobacter psychrotolerans]TDE10839.1 hypothetical protein E0F88_27585 [Dyadobacter psychrotolerans]